MNYDKNRYEYCLINEDAAGLSRWIDREGLNCTRRMLGVAAYKAITCGATECFKVLLEKGADPNHVHEFHTLLENAKVCKRTEIVRILKSYGIKDPDDESGNNSDTNSDTNN